MNMLLKSRIVFLAAVLALAACSKSTPEKKGDDPTAEVEDPKEAKAEEAPKSDIYPGFNFGMVKPSNRIKFVKFAKAELCPCEGNDAVSLHQCLQKTEGRCKVAMQVAEMGAMMYEAGFSETDVADKVSEYVDATKKNHVFKLDGRPFKGDENAPVVLVEFADFQCPHCREASLILSDIVEDHGKDVKVVYKHFPLSGHSFAPVASQAAVAAHRQGKFWPMHDLLFKHQKNLDPERLMEFAQRIGLNIQKFKEDLNDPAVVQFVTEDRKEGEDAKLTGTPSLYLNGKLYTGDIDEKQILDAIKQAKALTTETN